MNLSPAGMPALILLAGFIVVFAAPVWLAARVVGAEYPTLPRSIAALALGIVMTVLAALFTGGWALLLSPLAFLLSFKYVLGTSLFGAVLLAIVAATGYALMGHLTGGGSAGGGLSA